MLEDYTISFTLFDKIHNKKDRQLVLLDKILEKEWLRDDLTEKHIKEIFKFPFIEDKLNYHSVNKDYFKKGEERNHEGILNAKKYPELIFVDL